MHSPFAQVRFNNYDEKMLCVSISLLIVRLMSRVEVRAAGRLIRFWGIGRAEAGLLRNGGGLCLVHERVSATHYLVLYVPFRTASGVRFKSAETRFSTYTSGGSNEQKGG
jgi:hypothetical protein